MNNHSPILSNAGPFLSRRAFLKTATTASAGTYLSTLLPASGQNAETPPYQFRPLWFDGQRVHLHFIRSNGQMRVELADAVSKVKGGVIPVFGRVYTRHVKSNENGCFWPTATGAGVHPYVTTNPYQQVHDYVADMIADAQGRARMIGYFWDSADGTLASANPAWTCRNAQNETIETADPDSDGNGRGAHLCFNSPYREIVANQLRELVAKGVDAIYFDWRHMPACYCLWCQGVYGAGSDRIPPPPLTPTLTQAATVQEYANQTIQNTFAYWHLAVHEAARSRFPARDDVLLIVSSGSVSTLNSFEMSTDLFPILDVIKAEWSGPVNADERRLNANDIYLPRRDTKLAAGWCLLRNGAPGRPAHIWTRGLGMKAVTDSTGKEVGSERVAPSDPAYETQRQISVLAASSLLTHGCIANLHAESLIDLNTVAPANEYAVSIADGNLFNETFALSEMLSPVLAGTRPLAWAAVHFSEQSRRKLDPLTRNWQKIWRYSTSRSYWAYHTLLRSYYPASLISDHDLNPATAGVAPYKVLFLPNPGDLTPDQNNVVNAFESAGGVVRHPDEDNAPNWYSEASVTARGNELLAALQTAIQSDPRVAPPYRVTKRLVTQPDQINHVSPFVSHDGRRLILMVVNDFSVMDTPAFGAVMPLPMSTHQGLNIVLRRDALGLGMDWPLTIQTLKVRRSQQATPSVSVSAFQPLTPVPLGPDEMQITLLPFEFLTVLVLDFTELKLSISREANDIRLTWPSLPGETFEVQRSLSLASNGWSILSANWPANAIGATTSFLHTGALSDPVGFYRVRRLP